MSSTNNSIAMFNPDWGSMPLQARYASIEAAKAGLQVTVENVARPLNENRELCIVWSGSEKQFRAIQYFSRFKIFPKHARWCYPTQLRGYLNSTGFGTYRFVIEWCNEFSGVYAHRHKQRAMKDEGYLRFRDLLLSPLPMNDLSD